MSDPSQALTSFMNRAIKKSRSETENVDIIGTDNQEVEAGTLHDGWYLVSSEIGVVFFYQLFF